MTGQDEFLHQLAKTPGFKASTNQKFPKNDLLLMADEVYEAELDGHPFRLMAVMHESVMAGKGWELTVSENPSEKPSGAVTDRRIKNNPIYDSAFVTKAAAITLLFAERVRQRIRDEWGQDSFVVDESGNVSHPIFASNGSSWVCGHCEASHSAKQISENMWHCRNCGASPVDIRKLEMETGHCA